MSTQNYTIKTNKIQESRINEVDWDNIVFGHVFSDHMLVMDYTDGEWQEPEIMPFGALPLHPATSAIHYGQSIFEGMKAYRKSDGTPVVFRPEMNATRFRKSAYRMCMADIPEDLFMYCLMKLLNFDKDWVPVKQTNAMYIRPFMFATDGYTGIKPSQTYRFMIFTCPVGPYYTEPIGIKIEEEYTRANIGGVGFAKTAGNYAAALYPTKLAQEAGYQQIIWTDGQTHEYVEEAGTMNVLFVKDGKLISPAESETILAGITKRSLIEVAQSKGIQVEERKISVKEIIEGIKDGSVTEAFGAGTAATVAPIKLIGFRGENYHLAPITDSSMSQQLKNTLDDIKYGRAEDTFGWLKEIN
ncbi:MAG: branched-chain amino acid aminotransferase [Brumimicrobium sp.]|nr:branched-chain amino acid aminotransferase [Brumimicrobium sp.]